MSPSITTVILSTLLAASALAPVNAAHGGSNHRAVANARRSPGANSREPVHQVNRRSVTLGRRADGGVCKARTSTASVSAAASATASATSSATYAAASSAAPVSSWAASTTDASSSVDSAIASSVAYVADAVATSSAAVATSSAAATTSSEAAWSAEPTTSSAAVESSVAAVQNWAAPTTSTVSSAAPVASVSVSVSLSVSSSSTVKKAGLAWPNGNSDQPGVWASAIGNSWYYTWSPWPVDQLTGLEFVPMLWGWRQVGDWTQNIDSYASLGVKAALFLNEPNNAGQSNCGVESGCELWTTYFEQLRTKVPGIQLGSAAPDGAPSGKAWLQNFQTTCPQAQPDFYSLHWYDVTYEAFQTYVLDFANTFNKPIWVTEYACQNYNGGAQCSSDYISGDFFQGTTEWMLTAPQVARFAAFGAMEDNQGVNTANGLMKVGGDLTDLGWRYVKAG